MPDEFDYEDDTPSADSDDQTTENDSSNDNAVEAQINDLVASMEEKDGKWVFPEGKTKGVDPAILYAAKAEKRVRDNQKSFTKAQQKLKELETVNKGLTEHMINNATLHLTDVQREELDDLRTSDPEKWRERLNEHEQEAKTIQQNKINEFGAEGKKVSESEMRKQAYAEFTERTGIELSDQVIENQLPALYTKKLSSGDWDFDKFLTETEAFLAPKTTIKNAGKTDKELYDANDKDMAKIPGGKTPADTAVEGDAIQSYAKEVY